MPTDQPALRDDHSHLAPTRVAARSGGDIVPGYRPVSMVAVFAALAGVCSALALVTPILWFLPLLALGLSLMALRDVAPGADCEPDSGIGDDPAAAGEGGLSGTATLPDRKTGRWWALAGLALSLGFGAQAVATTLSQRAVAFSRSEAAARMFIDMVRADRMADAIKVCLPQVIPPPMGKGIAGRSTPDVQVQQAEASLSNMEVIQAIQACAGAAPIETRCIGAEERLPSSWAVAVRIGPCEGGGKPVDVKMLMQSKPVTRGQRQYDNWMVAGITLDRPE